MMDADYKRELDPLELTSIGEDVVRYDYDRGEEDNPLYLWVKPSELDEADGWPDNAIIEETEHLSIDVDEHMDSEVPLREPFEGFMPDVAQTSDARIRSSTHSRDMPQFGLGFDNTNPSDDDDDNKGRKSVAEKEVDSNTTTDDGDDGNDDDDDGDGGAGASEWPLSPIRLTPFTCERMYDHATQDVDHGARSSRPAPAQQFICRKKALGGEQDASFAQSFSSIEVTDTQCTDSFPQQPQHLHSSHSFHGNNVSNYGSPAQSQSPSYGYGSFGYCYGQHGYGTYSSYGYGEYVPEFQSSPSQMPMQPVNINIHHHYPPSVMVHMDQETYQRYMDQYRT